VLYLYAFVRDLDGVPAVAGLQGEPPELLRIGSLDAVVSGHERLDPEIAADSLVAHAAVVDALMAETDELVPVRFGSVFEDEHSLRAAATAKEPGLEDVLGRVRGRVEFGLHVVRARPAAERERPKDGRERLLGKLEELRCAEKAAELDAPLVQLAVDSRRRLLRTPRLLLSAAYLIERADAEEFADRARAIVEGRPRGVEVLSTGPWPPYSFAEFEDAVRVA